MADKKKTPGDWNLESAYDVPATIEDLIQLAPFKDASDTKGGSFTAASRVPTWLERKIMWFIEMKGSPYQLKSDVVRDMIYLGARVLHARYRGNPNWATESKMAEAIGQVGVAARIREQINQLERGLQDLWNEGDEKQAIEGLENFIAAAVEITDEWQKHKTLQYVRNNRLLKEIATHCSENVKKAIAVERK
ncbi:MAG: hypothetical protein PHU23_17940 [Dehalococcoidales bacterium]|nr:hypothetical protein [Dehalococcoidales bacterium]